MPPEDVLKSIAAQNARLRTEQNRNLVLGLTPSVLGGGNSLASQETSRAI